MEETQAPLESFAQRADLPESIVSSRCCVRPLSPSEQGEQEINELFSTTPRQSENVLSLAEQSLVTGTSTWLTLREQGQRMDNVESNMIRVARASEVSAEKVEEPRRAKKKNPSSNPLTARGLDCRENTDILSACPLNAKTLVPG
jgi:hypothetical protein